MSPPVAASLRARREARQPRIEKHGGPLSECIDVASVTPETDHPPEHFLNTTMDACRDGLATLDERRSARRATRAFACVQPLALPTPPPQSCRGRQDGALDLRPENRL